MTAFGIAVGTLWWVIAAAFGTALILQKSPLAFDVLKFAGAAYLCYLGVRSLMGSWTRGIASAAPDAHEVVRADGRSFRQGLVSNLLNPKTGPFFLTVLPQFLRSTDSPARLVLMVLVFEAMLLIWLNLYGYVVSRARRRLATKAVGQVLSRLTGVVLIGLGVRLATENA